MVQLLDLPDELILTIMYNVKPRVLLLCSIIGIENNRLKQLAIDKCQSLDLTFDYRQSPHERLMKRFYSHVLPSISNNIQSLTLTLDHLTDLLLFALESSDETFPNLTNLKIMIQRKRARTGTTFTLGNNKISGMHGRYLFSVVPQLFAIETMNYTRLLSILWYSRLMRSIISFELDEDCILPSLINGIDQFFPCSPYLNDIRITLMFLDDCIYLLNQLGTQLHSFAVNLAYPCLRRNSDAESRIKLICCPYLKKLTLTSYRNIPQYQRYILPFLQRFSTIEYLTLLLAVGVEKFEPRHFIDGDNLQKDILCYIPHLRLFQFHIRSIVINVPHKDINTIRQSFVDYEQSVDCTLDYFNNRCGQCQIFSLPFIGTRLDFISNRFPFFDESRNTFFNVTTMVLFDDVKPFEHTFFRLVSQALPHLKSLEVFNRLGQEEKVTTTTDLIVFPYLTTLILYDINIDYVEEFLCRIHLPCLVELLVPYELLAITITLYPEEMKNNCSKIEFLYFVNEYSDQTGRIRSFFPML